MQKDIKNILVPVNFAYSSENSIATAVAMCKRHNAILHLLYVTEGKHLLMVGKHYGTLEMAIAAEVAVQDKLELQAKEIANSNQITCFFHTTSGPFYEAVAKKVTDLYIDLLVIEKPASSGLFEFRTGHDVYKMLSSAGCPVLSVPDEAAALNFKRVLFPLRAVPAGLKKLDIALPIMKMSRSKVTLFSLLDERQSDAKLINTMTMQADNQMLKEGVDKEVSQVKTTRMAEEVISKSVENASDLIVITANAKKGLKSLFTSSYTEKILKSSRVPVLSVK